MENIKERREPLDRPFKVYEAMVAGVGLLLLLAASIYSRGVKDADIRKDQDNLRQQFNEFKTDTRTQNEKVLQKLDEIGQQFSDAKLQWNIELNKKADRKTYNEK